ncbi:MAG: hypothetical protein P4L48_18250 [Mycobacterium sp.]|nr:hypothetical protein [Mycobacterium sp.]
MPAETLHSYLYRMTEENHLLPGWLPKLARRPGFLMKLAVLTGYSDHQLVAMLPELRSPFHLRSWPHLIGQPSVRASTRAPCGHCQAARLGTTDATVSVFATHEHVICHRHHRWIGTHHVKCTVHEQFSIAACPEIAIANRFHKRLINGWGRGPTRACFDDAIQCVMAWSRWTVVMADPHIQRRWRLLGVTEETPPLRPREMAALYPNAVALTELILTLRRRITAAGRMTTSIAADSVELLSTTIIGGLTPSGAGDPFRQALTDVRPEPATEAESDSETTELEARR